jgi:Fe2+ or Zn2+ uptake regulation protein
LKTEPKELLRQQGLQVTNQRVAILESVADQPHCTADFVESDIRKRICSISRQAVYDGLRTLVQHGLLRRIQPSRSPARFETRTGDNHHHLICRSCSRMIDVDCTLGHAPCLVPSDSAGYEVHEAEVIYWGHCPDCRTIDTTPRTRKR